MDAAAQPLSPGEPGLPATAPRAPDAVPTVVKRHRLSTRIWHWISAVAVIVLLMTGLMIFNAHPRLYWGQYGANADAAWLEIGAQGDSGYLKIGETSIPTTGVLGRYTNAEGQRESHAFPYWATIPSYYSLAAARRWHFFFAWIFAVGLLAYMITSFINRHAQRDLGPSRQDFSPKHLWHEIKDHARLRFPTGEAAVRYNTLQRLSYFGVIFLLMPLIILTGLTMSPGMNAAWPWLLDIFGGRQSARSLHFIAAGLTLAFIIVHLLMVVLAGPINEIGSMITGKYKVPQPKPGRTSAPSVNPPMEATP